MKFKSKFGTGELVYVMMTDSGGRCMPEIVARVIAVTFERGDSPHYTCRLPNGVITNFLESELIGDPEFNQELGDYPVMGNGG